MRRLVGILFAAALAVGAAIITWPQFFRLERTFPVAQIVPFRAALAFGFAALLLIALLFALSRAMRFTALAVALVAVVAGTANVAILLGRGTGTDTMPAKTDTSLRVMTWNTAGQDATSADTIAQVAVAMDADIVMLPETTITTGEQVAIRMREMSRPMWAHHAEYGDYGIDGWDATSTTILIAPELGDYSVIQSSRDGSSNTSTLPSAVAMPVSGDGPIVVAAHAVAPRPAYMERWRDDLQWLADQCVDGNVIIAGDFNATLDHMHGLGIDGGTLGHCHDVASETGNGGLGTWPTDIPALLGAPIDHIMASEHWRPSGSAVLKSLDGSGSDHRPVIVQLEPVE